MTNEISLIILIEVKPGRGPEQINAFKKLLPFVLAEPGCLKYELNAVTGDEDRFVLIEKWTSEEALSAHDATPYMVAADALNPTFRAKPATILRIETI